MSTAKPFDIAKRMVWDSYLDVKRSGGGPGVDGQNMEEFEKDLKNNLYKIWNRMCSGSYFPSPVLRVEIPKAGGGVRALGIPTVSDRIAQAVAKRYLEPLLEPHFHEDSYGYRPGRSALDAVATARQRCWRDNWVLDLDIKQFFDCLDHGLLMRAVRRFTRCKWVLLYIERWLKVDVKLKDGSRQTRDRGTPQGGVISPLLANLFLHLSFDQWIKDNFPCIHFERYADDIVVHCRSLKQSLWIKGKIERRLRLCLLELHPEKTKIVFCKDSRRQGDWEPYSFDFMGFTFRPRVSRNRRGEFFVSFTPAISPKAAKRLRQTVRRVWKLGSKAHLDLEQIAQHLNPVISGWINYYGSFCRSALHPVLNHINAALVKWAMYKFKRLRRRKTRAHNWLKGVARRDPNLFVHWSLQGWMTRAV